MQVLDLHFFTNFDFPLALARSHAGLLAQLLSARVKEEGGGFISWCSQPCMITRAMHANTAPTLRSKSWSVVGSYSSTISMPISSHVVCTFLRPPDMTAVVLPPGRYCKCAHCKHVNVQTLVYVDTLHIEGGCERDNASSEHHHGAAIAINTEGA